MNGLHSAVLAVADGGALLLLVLLPFLVAVWLVRWLVLPAEDRAFFTLRRALAGAIERRLGGYRHQVNPVDPAQPLQAESRKRVAIIGSGLSGIGAASTLAERGFEVTIFERDGYFGGKIGAWSEQGADGEQRLREHGFHAFFRHYYNLNGFIDRIGARKNFTAIDDYLIIDRDGETLGFKQVEPAPVLNLVSLAKHGVYRWRDIIGKPAMHKMDVFLAYDGDETVDELDHTSFQQFADEAQLPKRLRLAFNTFSRAFFAEEDRMSMAELVKSFHFYYLSHDHGLLYDYPNGDYQRTLLGPMRDHLAKHGARVALSTAADAIGREGGQLTVCSQPFDYVVLATDVVGARAIAAQSPAMESEAPALHRALTRAEPSQRYAVMRVWLDKPIREDIPVFVSTDRLKLLDAVSIHHRAEVEHGEWVRAHGGSVLELHSYAVPDDVADDAEVRQRLLAEMVHFFPELSGYRLVDEHLQVRRDFSAFHTGMAAQRPATGTAMGGLYLAGDWVKLPFPAMLMEGAFSSGMVAANLILASEGLRQQAMYSVPPRGILADLRKRKLRAMGQLGTAPAGAPAPSARRRSPV